MTGGDDFEMERLRAEIQQEKQMKDMLDQSLGELHMTVNELDKRMEGIDEESNEWKTRYETQVEMNQQLEEQVISLTEKLEDARQTWRDSKLPKSTRTIEEPNEVTAHYVKRLDKEKLIHENQLRDFEWRLDQESKAYHKANEERKQYVTEIKSTKDQFRSPQRLLPSHSPANTDAGGFGGTPRPMANSNIPQDQRVIDPRMGPIRKTAAVKTLPRLD